MKVYSFHVHFLTEDRSRGLYIHSSQGYTDFEGIVLCDQFHHHMLAEETSRTIHSKEMKGAEKERNRYNGLGNFFSH